jgi:L-2,4-diaminobutyrate decarboxylase
MGHQVTSPLPPVALAQLCTTLLNNGAAVYEMGPVAMAMEKNLVKYFSNLIGYSPDADGIFTHGGSAGNLTAMLAVRQVKSEYNVWEEGSDQICAPGSW